MALITAKKDEEKNEDENRSVLVVEEKELKVDKTEIQTEELKETIAKSIKKIQDNLTDHQQILIVTENGVTKPSEEKPMKTPVRQTEAVEPAIPAAVQKTAEAQPKVRNPETEAKKPAEKDNASKPDHVIPYLMHLIRKSAFREAAAAYRKDLARYSGAYTLRLEVVCQHKSILTAFKEGNFNPRMYILPKRLKHRKCFGVFWGLFSSLEEARKEISAIPSFFTQQKFPPEPVPLGKYLRAQQ